MQTTSTSKNFRMGPFKLGMVYARLIILSGMAVLYTVLFPFIVDWLGPVGTALITVPVALAGWYFGIGAGLAASLASILLNTVLFRIVLGYEWITALTFGWPGNIMLILVAFFAGGLKQRSDEQAISDAKLHDRERFLSLSNLITMDILDVKQPDDRHYRLLSSLTNLFVADYGYIVRWDEVGQQADILATTLPSTDPNTQLTAGESSLIARALKTGAPILVEDSNSEPMVLPPSFENLSPPIRSAVIIPVMAGEYKFGTATLLFHVPRSLPGTEIEGAKHIGEQIALALRTIEQESEIHKRLREANALANIAQVLSETEHVGLETVLQLIVDSAKELIPEVEQAVIHLLDNEHQVLVPQAVSGFKKPSEGHLNMRLGEGIAGHVIETGEVMSIADVDSDASFLPKNKPARFRSLMVAPVESGEKRLGTISVQSGRPNTFSPGQQSLLRSLGTLAAIAIENAHLLETTQQGLKEVNALYHITQGLAASLDTGQLMQDAVDLLQKNFGYYQAEIFVIEPETEDLVVQQASGKTGELLKGQRLPAGAGIVGHAAETGEPFFTNDVDKVVFFFPHPLLPDTRSELSLPIKVGESVLGVLDIQQSAPNLLTERDLQLVSTVAEQLGVALQKAKLYTDLQSSLQQEKSMRSQLIQSERLALVGRLLASVSHELNNPLQAIQNALFLLKDERGISAQGQQDLQIVLSEAERMAALIDRLRTSYRPTRKEDFQTIQLNSVVEDIYALASTHLRHNQIAFEFHPDPNLPPIAGLPDQLRQVVLNLLMNAVEAMPGGGRLSVTTEYTNDGKVSVAVSDTGNGIEPEILPNIFDAFVTNKEAGTGLGLTITFDIIHRHNGHITAQNAPGGGAIFTFWLPALGKAPP